MKDEIIILDKESTVNILAKTFDSLVEGVLGIAASDRKEWALSVSHLYQRCRSGKFLKGFIGEWNTYREKGKIKEDYIKTEQHQACLQELLDFLDKDAPDETRFGFVKNLFFAAAQEKIFDRDSLLPQQFMSIGRKLTSGEILVLSANYDLVKSNSFNPNETGATGWLNAIAEKSGLQYPELVESHDDGLMSKHLLTKRAIGNGNEMNEIRPGIYYRLTSFAMVFCKFLESVED